MRQHLFWKYSVDLGTLYLLLKVYEIIELTGISATPIAYTIKMPLADIFVDLTKR